MLDGLCRTWRVLSLDTLKPIQSIQKSEYRELVWGTAFDNRRCSFAVLLKLWVAEGHDVCVAERDGSGTPGQ